MRILVRIVCAKERQKSADLDRMQWQGRPWRVARLLLKSGWQIAFRLQFNYPVCVMPSSSAVV